MNHLSTTSSVTKPRRKFLKQLCAGYTATMTYPAWGISPINHSASLPSAGLLRDGKNVLDEKYWEMVRQQFTVPPHLVMVNAANLCPSPYFINEQVMADTKNLATNVSFQNQMITFSHISNVSGIALPAREICQMAKAKGILTLVDGAQSLGFMDLNLKEIGCDFYTSSTHKWLMDPMENGVLYANNPQMEKLWPTIIGAGWNAKYQTVDEKICVLGQRNDPSTAALPSILEFHQTIGKKNIENLVRQLCTYLKEQIQTHLPQAAFVTPLSPALSGGVVIISIPGKSPEEYFQLLYEEHGIACAPTGGIRFSPHIYNTLQDMDRIVTALVSVSA